MVYTCTVLLIHICNTHVACIEAHIHTSTLLNALFLSIFLISFAIRSVKKLLAWRNDMQWRRVAGIRELSLSCTIPCCKQLHKRCFHTLTIFSAKKHQQSQRSCTMTTSAFLPDRNKLGNFPFNCYKMLQLTSFHVSDVFAAFRISDKTMHDTCWICTSALVSCSNCCSNYCGVSESIEVTSLNVVTVPTWSEMCKVNLGS